MTNSNIKRRQLMNVYETRLDHDVIWMDATYIHLMNCIIRHLEKSTCYQVNMCYLKRTKSYLTASCYKKEIFHVMSQHRHRQYIKDQIIPKLLIKLGGITQFQYIQTSIQFAYKEKDRFTLLQIYGVSIKYYLTLLMIIISVGTPSNFT